MFSIRSIFFRPKRSDYPLAKFFYADLELRSITTDLDSFDGNKEPIRCQKLIEKLRKTQQRVMEVLWSIVRCCLHEDTRACRLYRDKFPEELRGDHMSGPLWFGAECLAAGSSVSNHEHESDELRPLARHITKVMETVRNKLREQCLKDVSIYPEEVVDVLRWFDYNWTEFEFSYVSRMCPVKSRDELYQQHLTTVLFSETTAQALEDCMITEEQMGSYDPVLMLAIPRLAIICGLEQEEGLLDLSKDSTLFPLYFRPHITVLMEIKQSLSTLSSDELATLKQCLASSLDPLQSKEEQSSDSNPPIQTEIITSDIHTDIHTDEQTDEQAEEQTNKHTDTQRLDQLQCLYLSISSIADQMITNHAKDLRQMLHHTFKMNQPFLSVDIVSVAKTDEIGQITTPSDCIEPRRSVDSDITRHDHVLESSTCNNEEHHLNTHVRQEPPVWVPDCEVTCCNNCRETFTLLKRKHHCRYCGKIFCQACTNKTAVLTFTKSKNAVRVCDSCHLIYTTLIDQQPSTAAQNTSNLAQNTSNMAQNTLNLAQSPSNLAQNPSNPGLIP